MWQLANFGANSHFTWGHSPSSGRVKWSEAAWESSLNQKYHRPTRLRKHCPAFLHLTMPAVRVQMDLTGLGTVSVCQTTSRKLFKDRPCCGAFKSVAWETARATLRQKQSRNNIMNVIQTYLNEQISYGQFFFICKSMFLQKSANIYSIF